MHTLETGKIQESMHILMHGMLAWPCILSFIDQDAKNANDPRILNILQSYQGELGSYPGGYAENEVETLYSNVVTHLVVNLNQTQLPIYATVLKHIFAGWQAANKQTSSFFTIVSTLVNPIEQKELLLTLLTREIDTNNKKNLVLYTQYSHLVEKMDLSIKERSDLIHTIYLYRSALLGRDTELLKCSGIRDTNDLINYICFNNDKSSIWSKLSGIQDDYNVLKTLYINTQLPVETSHPLPAL